MRFSGGLGTQSWRASIDTPHALVIALHIRDAAGLDVAGSVPPLEPEVALDADFVLNATVQAAAAWSDWWESMLDRHPEFNGVPPLIADPFPELDLDLRALIGIGLPNAEAWFNADKHKDLDVLRATGRPSALGLTMGLGEIVSSVEARLGRAAAPFNLLISVLPVTGVWGVRARRDHVLVSRAMAQDRAGYHPLLEPVVRELAQEP